MGIQVQSVASCTGYVFVFAGSAVYDKRQEQTGNWTPFEAADPDRTLPGLDEIMSAATYRNPAGSVGYVAVVGGGGNGQVYIYAPGRGVSGPVQVPPLPQMQPQSLLATESYIMYISLDYSQVVLVDFAQFMGIVPVTNSAYQVFQTPGYLDASNPLAAAKNSEGLWEVCCTQGAGLETVRQSLRAGSVDWSYGSSDLDVSAWPFGLYLCSGILYMFLTDREQVWVKRQRQLQIKRPPKAGVQEIDIWEASHLLNNPPSATADTELAAVIVAPGNYFMLFWIDDLGYLWRGLYDGTQDPVTWEYVGAPPGVIALVPWTLAVSIGTTGNVELFAVSDEGDLWQMWHTTETGVWSDWYLHGQPSD